MFVSCQPPLAEFLWPWAHRAIGPLIQEPDGFNGEESFGM